MNLILCQRNFVNIKCTLRKLAFKTRVRCKRYHIWMKSKNCIKDSISRAQNQSMLRKNFITVKLLQKCFYNLLKIEIFIISRQENNQALSMHCFMHKHIAIKIIRKSKRLKNLQTTIFKQLKQMFNSVLFFFKER